MTNKEVRRLSRMELLEILIAQMEENEGLVQENERLAEENRELTARMDRIAMVLGRPDSLLGDAEKSRYFESLRTINRRAEEAYLETIRKAQREADAIRREAERERSTVTAGGQSYWIEAAEKLSSLYDQLGSTMEEEARQEEERYHDPAYGEEIAALVNGIDSDDAEEPAEQNTGEAEPGEETAPAEENGTMEDAGTAEEDSIPAENEGEGETEILEETGIADICEPVEETEPAEEEELLEETGSAEEEEILEEAEIADICEPVEETKPAEEEESIGETGSAEETESLEAIMTAEETDTAEPVEETELAGGNADAEVPEFQEDLELLEILRSIEENAAPEEDEVSEETGTAEEIRTEWRPDLLSALETMEEKDSPSWSAAAAAQPEQAPAIPQGPAVPSFQDQEWFSLSEEPAPYSVVHSFFKPEREELPEEKAAKEAFARFEENMPAVPDSPAVPVGELMKDLSDQELLEKLDLFFEKGEWDVFGGGKA